MSQRTSHETTTAILHKNTCGMASVEGLLYDKVWQTLVRRVWRVRHFHDDVVQRCGLRDLPVKASCRGRRVHSSEINGEVPHRPVATDSNQPRSCRLGISDSQIVLADIPIAGGAIRVSIFKIN
jgi:hypothetical protein